MNKNEILNIFNEHFSKVEHTDRRETYALVAHDRLREVVTELVAVCGATLMTIFCTDERGPEGRGNFVIRYVFRIPAGNGGAARHEKELFVLELPVPHDRPEFPSITGVCVSANWYEREIFDMFGLHPTGHPDPGRLVHHETFPVEMFPLRKDFDASSAIVPASKIVRGRRVFGEGNYELPVGPIHAGIIEPGHFRFSCFGEHIINLSAGLFFTHRGIEKAAEGMEPLRANLLAERICGVCSFAHSEAFCMAVEKAAGVSVPKRASAVRTLLLEMERIAGHLTDVMGIAVDVAYYTASSYASIMREKVLSAVYDAVGSRYLHSVNAPGGLRRDISDGALASLAATAEAVAKMLDPLEDMLLSSTTFLERVETTGRLFTETAFELGIVGVGARGSGIPCDARKNFPYELYPQTPFDEIVFQGLDVFSRMKVRLDEIRQSAAIARAAVEALKAGPVAEKIGKIRPGVGAFGVVEAPKGEHVHFVRFGENSRISRYAVRSASYANWIALTFAVKGNIVPDFPVINKSFNLCYSACDR